jgi:hypothetical protein
LKIHFNIILPSPSLRSPHQNPVCTCPLPHKCYMPCPPQLVKLLGRKEKWKVFVGEVPFQEYYFLGRGRAGRGSLGKQVASLFLVNSVQTGLWF